jgi:dTMP kinase
MNNRSRPSMYVAVEGIDAAGKDTLAEALIEHPFFRSPKLVREPDESYETGVLLRKLLRTGEHSAAQAALFTSNRIELLAGKVMPCMSVGCDVISIRSFISTLVYQQEQHGCDYIDALCRCLPYKPTHVLLLDIPPEDALERLHKGRDTLEMYETRAILKRNRERYLRVLHDGDKWGFVPVKVSVNNSMSKSDVLEAAVAALEECVIYG